jgi:hypothetical protein
MTCVPLEQRRLKLQVAEYHGDKVRLNSHSRKRRLGDLSVSGGGS